MEEEILKQIEEIVDSPSFYSHLKRKDRQARIDDNIRWYEEYNYLNKFYNDFGLDIENFRNQDDYLEDWIIIEQRRSIHHDGIDPLLNRVIADNKFFFYSLMETLMPGYTPKLRVVLQGSNLFYPIFKNSSVSEAIKKLRNGKYVLKSILGMKGNDIYILEKKKGSLYLDNKKINIEKILELTKNQRYLIQDCLIQNSEFGKIAPNSVNTIRVETLRWHKEVHIYYAIARFSTKEDVSYDNASQGGTFVGVDIEQGTLREYGEYLNIPDKHELQHPISKIVYKDFKIPYWNEIVSLVKQIHPLFYELASIGWDIAITEDGPVIVEINSKPLGKMSQIANGGLKKRYYELLNK